MDSRAAGEPGAPSAHGGGHETNPSNGNGNGAQPRAEIYTYESSSPVFAMNWSIRRDKKFRLAIGSYLEQYENRIEIIQCEFISIPLANPYSLEQPRTASPTPPQAFETNSALPPPPYYFSPTPAVDNEEGVFRTNPALSFAHPYPATKVMFVPDREAQHPDLMASTSDILRVWRVGDDGVKLERTLRNTKNSEYAAPITSFDWNEADPNRIGTASIDTTCTIWDLERGVVDTQLIAHDREVYDIVWGGVGVFASVSADGSVRVFDLRDKEHSTIIYETPEPGQPLLRLAWNRQDPRYMATIVQDSPRVVVLDIRFPTIPVAELHRHQMPVSSLAWAPHSSCHICTAGEDGQALIWDLSSRPSMFPDGGVDPILAYTAGGELTQMQWSTAQPDWVAICFQNKTQLLRV